MINVYTIGQFARICNVSTETLRHYESIDLLRPSHINPENQYRYYSRDQAPTIRRVVTLRSLGLGLEGIRLLLQDEALWNEARLRPLLQTRSDDLDSEIASHHETLLRIREYLQTSQQNRKEPNVTELQVTIKEISPLPVVSTRRRIPLRDFHSLLDETARKLRSQPAGPAMTIYHDADFDPEEADIEVAFPVSPAGETQLPGVRVAAAQHPGTVLEIGDTYAALYTWISEHGYRPAGPVRELHQMGLGRRLVSEVQIPIE